MLVSCCGPPAFRQQTELCLLFCCPFSLTVEVGSGERRRKEGSRQGIRLVVWLVETLMELVVLG